jgi:hypothetical protein
MENSGRGRENITVNRDIPAQGPEDSPRMHQSQYDRMVAQRAEDIARTLRSCALDLRDDPSYPWFKDSVEILATHLPIYNDFDPIEDLVSKYNRCHAPNITESCMMQVRRSIRMQALNERMLKNPPARTSDNADEWHVAQFGLRRDLKGLQERVDVFQFLPKVICTRGFMRNRVEPILAETDDPNMERPRKIRRLYLEGAARRVAVFLSRHLFH